MSDLPASDRLTVPERWKTLADIDNRHARKNRGGPVGKYVPPATIGDPQEIAERERRDTRIEA